MRLLALLLGGLALLCLSGCPEQEECLDCQPPCERPPTPFMPQLPGMLLTGQPSVVHLHNARLGQCGGVAVSELSTLTAEVTDPLGTLVARETFDPSLPIAPFTFTLSRPGPHHFVVWFDPPGSLLQFSLDAAIDRSTEPPLLTRPGSCTALERTRSGAWVCDAEVYRGDTRVAEFPGQRLAVAGDVVWAVGATQVQRFVDTGSDLVPTGSLRHSLSKPEFVLPSADELVVLHGSGLVHYTASGGGLQASAPAAFNRFEHEPLSDTVTRGILLRDADTLALITASPSSPYEFRLCPYQLTASGPARTTQPCQSLPGSVAGFEPGVLWIRRQFESSLTIQRALWTRAQGLVEHSSITLNLSLRFHPASQSFQRSTVVPMVHSRLVTVPFAYPSLTSVVTWSPQWRSLVLEHMDGELTQPSASADFYWGTLPQSGQTPSMRVRSR